MTIINPEVGMIQWTYSDCCIVPPFKLKKNIYCCIHHYLWVIKTVVCLYEWLIVKGSHVINFNKNLSVSHREKISLHSTQRLDYFFLNTLKKVNIPLSLLWNPEACAQYCCVQLEEEEKEADEEITSTSPVTIPWMEITRKSAEKCSLFDSIEPVFLLLLLFFSQYKL